MQNLDRRVEVGVSLPGSERIVREIPPELMSNGIDVEKIVKYVVDGNLTGPNARTARAIVKETKEGTTYTIFVAKGNEQYKVGRTEEITKLFEIDPVTSRPKYRELNFTISRPRVGGL